MWCNQADTVQEPAGYAGSEYGTANDAYLVYQCSSGACARLRERFEALSADVDTPPPTFELDDLVVTVPRRLLAEECEAIRLDLDGVAGKGYMLDQETHHKIRLSMIFRLTGGEFGEELT